MHQKKLLVTGIATTFLALGMLLIFDSIQPEYVVYNFATGPHWCITDEEYDYILRNAWNSSSRVVSIALSDANCDVEKTIELLNKYRYIQEHTNSGGDITLALRENNFDVEKTIQSLNNDE